MSEAPFDLKYGTWLGPFYRRYVRHLIPPGLPRQRVKLAYDVWAYRPLLAMPRFLFRLLRIDLALEHAHKPCEITPLLLDLARTPGRGQVVVEAGCWKGGTTTKLSLACASFGYWLHVYDSFEGVPEWNYAYSAGQAEVSANVRRFGEPSVCTYHPGWFSDTLRGRTVPFPVRLAYIDCDTPAGMLDVLSGVVPSLTADGVIYTQDYHLREVRAVLHAPKTWAGLHVAPPRIEHIARNLARLTWH
jgi:Methyltransferase domain